MNITELATHLGLPEHTIRSLLREVDAGGLSGDLEELSPALVAGVREKAQQMGVTDPIPVMHHPTIEQLAVSLGITPGRFLTELKSWGIDIAALQAAAEQCNDVLINNLGIIETAVRGYGLDAEHRADHNIKLAALKKELNKIISAVSHKRVNPSLKDLSESLDVELALLMAEAKKYGVDIADPDAELSEEQGELLLDKLGAIQDTLAAAAKAAKPPAAGEQAAVLAAADTDSQDAATAVPPAAEEHAAVPAAADSDGQDAATAVLPAPEEQGAVPVAVAVGTDSAGTAGEVSAVPVAVAMTETIAPAQSPRAAPAVSLVLISMSIAAAVFGGVAAISLWVLWRDRFAAERPVAVSRQLTDRQHVSLIWEMAQQGFYKSALELSEQFLEQFPASSAREDVVFKVGAIFFDMKQSPPARQYQAAVRAFEAALEQYQHSEKAPWAMYMIGRSRAELRLYEDALTMYRHILDRFPRYEQRDQVLVGAADALFSLRRFEEAHLAYSGMLAAFPHSAQRNDALFKRAVCLDRLGQRPEAVSAYEEFIVQAELDVRVSEARLAVAMMLYEQGEYPAARAAFAGVIGRYPYDAHNAQAQFMIAECLNREEQYAAAREALQAVIYNYEQHPLSAEARYRLGDFYFADHKRDDARQAYLQALQRHPTHALAQPTLVFIGQLLLEENQDSAAVAVLEESLRRFPLVAGNDAVLLTIVQAYQRQADYANVVQTTQRLLDDYPASALRADVALLQADAYYALSLFAPAAERYMRFLNEYSESERQDWVYYRLAESMMQVSRYAEALSFSERGIALFPLSSYRFVSRMVMANALLAMGKQAAAIEQLTRLADNEYLDTEPVYAQSCLALARLFVEAEQPLKAIVYLDRVLARRRIDNDYSAAVALKGSILRGQQRELAAATLYEQAAEQMSAVSADRAHGEQIAEFLIAAALIYRERGELNKALPLLLRAQASVAVGQRRQWLLYQIGTAHQHLGEYEKAAMFYEQLKTGTTEDYWVKQFDWNLKHREWQTTITREGLHAR